MRARRAPLVCLTFLLVPTSASAAKVGSALHLEVIQLPSAGSGTARIRFWTDVDLAEVRIAVVSAGGRHLASSRPWTAGAAEELDPVVAPTDLAIVATARTPGGSRLAAAVPLHAEVALAEPYFISRTRVARRYRSAGPPPTQSDATEKARATLQGQMLYEDALYDEGGATGESANRPVRRARLTLVDADSGQVLATTQSDANGKFRLSLNASPGGEVVLLAATYGALDAYPLAVLDGDESQRVYEVESPAMTLSPGHTVSLVLIAADAAANAFNVFDQGVRAFDFIRTLSKLKPPRLTFFWAPGSRDGTYYLSDDDSIHLLGLSTDNDGMDDDVILHEIGHFYLGHYSSDDSPGGIHSPFATDLDPRLSWSEGFASYFSSAARNQASYVDTQGSDASLFFDWETGEDDWTGPGSEAAVTMSLWDLHDPVGGGEAFDQLVRRDHDVGRVDQEYLARRADIDVTFFCDGWRALRIRDLPRLQAVFGARSIPCP